MRGKVNLVSGSRTPYLHSILSQINSLSEKVSFSTSVIERQNNLFHSFSVGYLFLRCSSSSEQTISVLCFSPLSKVERLRSLFSASSSELLSELLISIISDSSSFLSSSRSCLFISSSISSSVIPFVDDKLVFTFGSVIISVSLFDDEIVDF